jgi:hypothetical protein
MVIEKLTKWHHGSELQLLSETSAHQMNENPSVILLAEIPHAVVFNAFT